MPELRKDPVTGRWVIVNMENPKKAGDFSVEPRARSTKICPFCPGHESMTPPEIISYGRKAPAKNTPGWQVRVIANKFPALRIEEPTEKKKLGVYERIGGFGAHEVIIENPDHEKEIGDLTPAEAELILAAYRDRCLDLRRDGRFQYILIFKNYGEAAGASLEHPHSQLIGLPIVPSRVAGELEGGARHHARARRCIFCDMLARESTEKKLTVFENADFTAFEPFASRFPFETWILPRAHGADFDAVTDAKIKTLAEALQKTLQKIRDALKNPSYNLMIHTLPIHGGRADSFHWHIEIIPHLTQVAGFELGTGFYVNPTPPELAADILKNH
ncbi:MAG: galactose-1-phosphate uridylyltransferase [Candidatus Omnitrophica bacterium]|nr:galactose-1-phosphate uridylyltransferase [Candidatus Omnitrophota bacterium]